MKKTNRTDSSLVDITILPFCKIDGVPTLRDSEIKALFEAMKEQGHLKTVFYDKSVVDADGFVREMKRRDTNFFAVYDLDKTPLAIFWLNTHEGRSARVHFCTFKAAFGRAPSIGRECLSRTLQMKADDEYVFDCLIGITPADNKLAVRALKRAGMVASATIPSMLYNAYTNKPMDAVLGYCTRKEVC